MQVLSFIRNAPVQTVSRSGHVEWTVDTSEKELPRELRVLGWNEEWEVVTFVRDHANEIARSLFNEPAPRVERERLGSSMADLELTLSDGSAALFEVKGPAMTAKAVPGVQLLDYVLRCGSKVSRAVVVCGIGGLRGESQRAVFNPVRWWQGAPLAPEGCATLTSLFVRVDGDRLALVTFDDPTKALSWLNEHTFVDRHRDTLSAWAEKLGRSKSLTATHLRSHSIPLGRTPGNGTLNRWFVRIVEDHVWLSCWFEPPPQLRSALSHWNELPAGEAANYEARRLLLGPLTDDFDVLAELRCALPSNIVKGLALPR